MMYTMNAHEGRTIRYTREGDPIVLIVEGIQRLQEPSIDSVYIHYYPAGEPTPVLTMTKIDTPPFIRFEHPGDVFPCIEAPDTLDISHQILSVIKQTVDGCLQKIEAIKNVENPQVG